MIAVTWVGTLPAWITLGGVILVAVILWRGGSATAVEGLQAINRELERQIHERDKQVKDLQDRVRALEQKTDVTLALGPVLGAMQQHEDNASARSLAALAIMGQIADRLGPDPRDD